LNLFFVIILLFYPYIYIYIYIFFFYFYKPVEFGQIFNFRFRECSKIQYTYMYNVPSADEGQLSQGVYAFRK